METKWKGSVLGVVAIVALAAFLYFVLAGKPAGAPVPAPSGTDGTLSTTTTTNTGTTTATSSIDTGSTSTGGGGILPYHSGVRGVVLLGPTCPVMRMPPEPQCADKPYQTMVSVSRAGATSVFAQMETGADGAFSFALPPGAYVLSAKGGAMLPRCASVQVSVAPEGYASTTISCDTGIR